MSGQSKSGVLAFKATREAFLRQRDHRIVFHFTPKRASWLNQIEIWFSILGDTAAHFKCRPCLMHRQTCDEKMDIDATALSQGLASERISTPPACDRR